MATEGCWVVADKVVPHWSADACVPMMEWTPGPYSTSIAGFAIAGWAVASWPYPPNPGWTLGDASANIGACNLDDGVSYGLGFSLGFDDEGFL